MKKFLLMVLLAVAAMPSFAEVIQYEGVYYDVTRDGSTGSGRVVAPPEGSYSGDIAVYSRFTLDGVTFNIKNRITDMDGFQNSTVRNFICGFNPKDSEYYQIALRNNKGLESIKFLYLNDSGFCPNWLVLRNKENNCVVATMCSNGDENLVKVERFNVYGPDGKLLKPHLMVESTGELIAPDENNVFHLDSNWMHNGEYCGVLPLSAMTPYSLVLLHGVGDDNKYACVRVEPLKGETGVYVQYNGVTYSINNDHAELGVWMNSGAAGKLVIPENIEYNGRQYPVTTIYVDAFRGSDITSVTLPSTITDLKGDAFSFCWNLESADLSKIKVTKLSDLFQNCENLKEVIFPQIADADAGMPLTLEETFTRCTALESVKLPKGTVVVNAFTESGVADFKVVEINESKVAFRCNKFNILDENGQPLPYKLYVEQRDYIDQSNFEKVIHNPTFVNGIYEFKYEDFLYTNYDGNQKFNGTIICAFDDTQSDAIGSGTFLSFNVNENDFSGIDDVEAEDNAPAVYYNLQGVAVPADSLTPGVYIERRGKTATKVLIK